MKALRFFLLSLLAAFSFAASAQTVEIYKDGRIIDSFTAAQVDSVVYTPTAAQPRYYYYAGWDCPSSVEDLEKLIDKEYPISNVVGETQFAKAGGEADLSKSVLNETIANTVRLCYGDKNTIREYSNEHGNYPLLYIVAPKNYVIRQAGGVLPYQHIPLDENHYYIEYGHVWSISNITITK